MADFQIVLQTPGAQQLGVLNKIVSCSYARTENNAGEMTLVLPGNVYSASMFQPYSRIVIYRRVAGGNFYVDLNTPWFLTNGPKVTQAEDGTELLTLECMDALGLILSSRIVAYNDDNEFTLKLDEADDMCKAVVRENLGSLASDTTRSIATFMTVAPDTSLAPIIKFGSFARQPVLDVLRGIADASAQDDTPLWLGFDIEIADPITGLLEFRTYTNQRGVDHRSPDGSPPVILSTLSGNLNNVEAGQDLSKTASVIYAGGAGFGDIRPIVEVQNTEVSGLSPFARIEKFVDGSQILEVESLEEFAKSELEKARPERYFTGQVIETASTIRGVHWDYGDYLTATHRDVTYDVRANKIAVQLDPAEGGGLIESVDVFLRGEANV